MPCVEQPDDRPALGHVAQLAERAQVAEEALGLVEVVERQDRVEQRLGVGCPPVVGHGLVSVAAVRVYRCNVLTRYHDDDGPPQAGSTILPAIDLRGGRVVRLEQGDFARETVFSDDPVAVARAFADAGARWLHVVDLDGARTGAPAHGAAIAAIVEAVGDRVAVEVAGGLRTAPPSAAALDAGAARVVIGTAALRGPGLRRGLVAHHGAGAIAVAIDVAGRRWPSVTAGPPSSSGVDAASAMRRAARTRA